MKLWHSRLVISGFFFNLYWKNLQQKYSNVILVPYLPTQIKPLIYLGKTEEMKLCCPKQILSSIHYSKPHFAVAAEELSQAPSSSSGSWNTYQVTPLTQAMLSTFHWLLFFASGQGYRQKCPNLSFGLCLLHVGKHEPQRFSIFTILNSKRYSWESLGLIHLIRLFNTQK